MIPEVGEAHDAVAVEVGIGVAREEGGLEHAQVAEVHDEVAVQIGIAEVAEAVVVRVALDVRRAVFLTAVTCKRCYVAQGRGATARRVVPCHAPRESRRPNVRHRA